MRTKKTLITMLFLMLVSSLYWYASGYRLSEDAILSEFYDYYETALFDEVIDLGQGTKIYTFVTGDSKDISYVDIEKSLLGYRSSNEVGYSWGNEEFVDILNYADRNDMVNYVFRTKEDINVSAYQYVGSDYLSPKFEDLELNEISNHVFYSDTSYYGFMVFSRGEDIVAVSDGIYSIRLSGTTSVHEGEYIIDFPGIQKNKKIVESWTEIPDYDFGLTIDVQRNEISGLEKLGSFQFNQPNSYYDDQSGKVDYWSETLTTYYENGEYILSATKVKRFDYDVDNKIVKDEIIDENGDYIEYKLIHPFNFNKMMDFIEEM